MIAATLLPCAVIGLPVLRLMPLPRCLLNSLLFLGVLYRLLQLGLLLLLLFVLGRLLGLLLLLLLLLFVLGRLFGLLRLRLFGLAWLLGLLLRLFARARLLGLLAACFDPAVWLAAAAGHALVAAPVSLPHVPAVQKLGLWFRETEAVPLFRELLVLSLIFLLVQTRRRSRD